MNGIHLFEIMCYIITALLLWDIFRKKNTGEFRLFLSAALAGFVLELLAVRVTGIYHYSPDWYISIGLRPYQFPFFGGLMWGGLTVCALRLSQKLKMNHVRTALFSGWLIVMMDILLDVAAIRLDGGFWVWEGREITLDITHHMFMSVIWVNFLGYLFETPAMVWMYLRTKEKADCVSLPKQILYVLFIGLCGVGFVGAASGASLALNAVTDEWFACIAFILLWMGILTDVLCRRSRRNARTCDPVTVLFWSAMYVFCLAALYSLGIAQAVPLYYAFGIAAYAFTLALCLG